MRTHRLVVGAFLLAGALVSFGCSTPKPEPDIQSSAPQSGYAERYPQELQASASRFGEREDAAKRVSGELQGYPKELKDPSWPHVLQVMEEADAAGRSYDYVERSRRAEGAAAFFKDNKEDISKKVAGAAQYVAKQKGCDVDVTGAVAHALEESVDKQVEEYLRERNEAHRSIDRYRASLGKENAAKLEKQADSVSMASYIVHIDMVEQKLRIRRMLEEIETIKQSTDQAIADEREFQSGPKRTDEEKKASEERIKALNQSKAMLESASTQAKTVADGMEEHITATQKEYREAFDKLRAALRERAGLPPEPPREE